MGLVNRLIGVSIDRALSRDRRRRYPPARRRGVTSEQNLAAGAESIRLKGKIMRDEIYDREYQAGRAELHAGIDRLVLRAARFLAATFNAIHAIQFAAPWRQEPRRLVRHRSPGTA